MTTEERMTISGIILQVIQDLQPNANEWVDFARIGAPLTTAGVYYKQFGYPKLRPFLNEFQDVLEFKDVTVEGKPPVCYVRKRTALGDCVEIDNHKKNDNGILNLNHEKPPFQFGKSPLLALGYVRDIQGAIDYLSRKVGVLIRQDELEEKLKTAYDEGDILYYEYGVTGNPIKRTVFSSKTAIFAVSTGMADNNGFKIYAQYNKGPQGWSGVYFNTEVQIFNTLNVYKIGRITFKDYSQANRFIKELQSELLPGEMWKYAEPAQEGRKKTEYEILESYLRTVFAALVQEYNQPGSLNYGKIRFSKDNNYALFNTGLLSKYAKDIIIVGEVFPKNRNPTDRFTLSNPVLLRRGKTELQEKGFSPADIDVDMVSFFAEVSQIVYDATAEVDTDDINKLHHCIEEGIQRNRFPQECKEQYENGDLEKLTDTFTGAIQRAQRIARRNYKYVVPQYRTSPQGNRIQFLMPIYMLAKYDESPDFALVLSESTIDGQKFYKPETVLELAWAYNNARVICKPDDTWLNPDRIEDSVDPEDDLAYGN